MTGPSDETDMRCAWMSSWVRSAMRSGGPPRGSLTRHLRGERPTGRHDRNRHVCAWCCHARGRATAYVPLELSVTCDGGPYRTEYLGLPVATRWRGGGLFPVSSFAMARVGRSLARRLRRGPVARRLGGCCLSWRSAWGQMLDVGLGVQGELRCKTAAGVGLCSAVWKRGRVKRGNAGEAGLVHTRVSPSRVASSAP